MKQDRKRIMVAAGGGVFLAALLLAVPGLATPSSGFGAIKQDKGAFGSLMLKGEKDGFWDFKLQTKDDTDMYVVRNAVAPGGHSGWHTHPGPSLITVTVGEITAYDGHDPLCSFKTYHAGETFVDEGGGHVHLLRNNTSQAAETVAVQFLPKGATRRIDVPTVPTNCQFLNL